MQSVVHIIKLGSCEPFILVSASFTLRKLYTKHLKKLEKLVNTRSKNITVFSQCKMFSMIHPLDTFEIFSRNRGIFFLLNFLFRGKDYFCNIFFLKNGHSYATFFATCFPILFIPFMKIIFDIFLDLSNFKIIINCKSNSSRPMTS